MHELYVKRSIKIDAKSSHVWEVLTKPEFTEQWAGAFGATGPIDSSWILGGEVSWKNAKGDVYVNGQVTDCVPGRLLRFTVCDIFNPSLQPSSGLKADEITQSYSLAADGKGTILSTAHGDFAKLPNGATLFPMVEQVWVRLLPTLKELAERTNVV